MKHTQLSFILLIIIFYVTACADSGKTMSTKDLCGLLTQSINISTSDERGAIYKEVEIRNATCSDRHHKNHK